MLENENQSPQSVVPPSSVPTPLVTPRSKFPIIPLLIGFFIVVIIAAALGVVYYKSIFKPDTSNTPAPSLDPSASPSATPKSSSKPSAKPSLKPVSALPSSTPSPTPVAIPTFDIRFGNPSANIKQTYDDGSGVSRVINREYTSIQAGQFDEVKSAWSPRVTICYHIVSNEEVKGNDVKFTFKLDDKEDVKDNLGQYDKLEAGRLYDWCHDVTNDIGKHTARLILNPDKNLKELIYTNSIAYLEWENLKDNVAPNFTLIGPNNEGASGTCLSPQFVSDNVSASSALKIEQKVDSGIWTTFLGSRYCLIGITGAAHTFSIKITDERGNVNQQGKSFVLY